MRRPRGGRARPGAGPEGERGLDAGRGRRPAGGAAPEPGAGGARTAKTAKRSMLRFLLLFVLFWTAFFFVAWIFTDRLAVLCPWTATQVCWAMRLLGVESSCSGSLVSFGPRSVTIVMECTALQVAMIYAALILAYPSTAKAKAIGLGIGLPLILAVNVVRLVVICFVLWWKPAYFEMMHIYIWQVVFIVIVVAMAAVWIEKVVHRERRASVSR